MNSMKKWLAHGNNRDTISLGDLDKILYQLEGNEVAVKVSNISPISFGMLGRVTFR